MVHVRWIYALLPCNSWMNSTPVHYLVIETEMEGEFAVPVVFVVALQMLDKEVVTKVEY